MHCIAMPMPFLAALCPCNTAQIYVFAHLCHAFASHIAATHSHCLAMQSSALAPQCCAKALPLPCISKRRTSSQCLCKSMPRLTKQCPRLAWPSYATANPYDAMPERCCTMRSNALAVQCDADALRINASAFLVAVDQLVVILSPPPLPSCRTALS